MATSRITRFESMRAPHEVTQERSLAWLAAAHAEAEAHLAGLDELGRAAFERRIARLLERIGCGPDRIARRGQSIGDIERLSWDGDTIYDLHRHPRGRGSEARTHAYRTLVERYFMDTYATEGCPPDELVHVTCTGYIAPSGAQRLVATRRWPTRVTHAYHMGCYAAIPALRIASGFAAAGAVRIDIAHTELCSLHVDPSNHAPEQLVVQSLFGDGYIRYTVEREVGESRDGLRVLALHERVIPESAAAMSWSVGDVGMRMTLARDIPDQLAAVVRGFVIELCERAGVGLGQLAEATFAVHPGGPKIIDRVRDVLELGEAQVATSRMVLRDHGNMSSATLPHIWQRIVEDPRVAPRTLVPTLAFGPGLTICGALLEKA